MEHVDGELYDNSGTHHVATVHGVDYDPHRNLLPQVIRHKGHNYLLFYDTSYNTSNGTAHRARNVPIYRATSTQAL